MVSCILEIFSLYSLIVADIVRPFLNNLSLPLLFPRRVVMVKTNERLRVQILNISEFLWVPFGPTFRIWKQLSSKGLDLSGTITLEEPSTPRDFKPQVSKIQPQIKMNRFFYFAYESMTELMCSQASIFAACQARELTIHWHRNLAKGDALFIKGLPLEVKYRQGPRLTWTKSHFDQQVVVEPD